jgi:hypothetical protein
MLASMRNAHDDVDPWADADALETVELGNDPPPAPQPPQSQPKAKPFRTAPLTSLPARKNAHDLFDDEGPRRRSSHTTPRDSPEPYAAASGSAYGASPSRSTSHPLELDTQLKTPPKGKGRERSSSGPSPLSPLGASLSPLSASPALSASGSRLRAPQPQHSLAGLGGLGGNSLSDLRDVSRPGLARVTSETERAASVGSWSATNSDFGEDDAELVDVIVHSVGGGESLPGIALRYGIELPVLRKANKLWPSDPLLRTQLFVPLENCRASADSWVERDEAGAVLVRRRKRRRGSGSEGTVSPASPRTLGGDSAPSTPRGDPPRLPDAPGEQERVSEELERIPLEVARVPASQLRFFPHRAKGARSSLEDRRIGHDTRRPRGLFAALSLGHSDEDEYEPRAPHRVTVRSGAYAEPPTSPKRDKPKPKEEKRKTKVVRLRPPVAQPPPPPGAGIASRLQSFFSVPPPPTHLPPPVLPPLEPPINGAERVRSPELVEMDSAPQRRTDKKRD